MICTQLGGACDKAFRAETFAEVAEMSKKHGMEMYQRQEPAHMEAMGKMTDLMSSPEAMEEWLEEREKEFNALPEDK